MTPGYEHCIMDDWLHSKRLHPNQAGLIKYLSCRCEYLQRGDTGATAGQRRGEMEAGGETSLFISSLNLALVACYILRGTTCRLLSVLKIYNCQELRTLNLNLNLNPQQPSVLTSHSQPHDSYSRVTHRPLTSGVISGKCE